MTPLIFVQNPAATPRVAHHAKGQRRGEHVRYQTDSPDARRDLPQTWERVAHARSRPPGRPARTCSGRLNPSRAGPCGTSRKINYKLMPTYCYPENKRFGMGRDGTAWRANGGAAERLGAGSSYSRRLATPLCLQPADSRALII